MTTTITLRPPDGMLYAAVEVWASNGGEFRKVGAYPAFWVEEIRDQDGKIVERVMHPSPQVAVPCYLEPADTTLRCHWVYEDSALGLNTVERHVNERRYR